MAVKSKRFNIGTTYIRPGETKDVYLKISEYFTGDPISLPIRVIRARRRGPCIFVSATVHGDELNGMGIVHDLMFGPTIRLQKGTLILAPVINIFGFESQDRYMPDRRDLNRFFPGSKTGNLTSRVANLIFNEIIKKSDYGIELHTAAQPRANFPNVRGDMKKPDVRKLATAFGAELILDGRGPDGSLRREATKAGCPTIILEAGEPLKIQEEIMQVGVRGVLNVLKYFDMLPGEPEKPMFQVRASRSTWVRAEVGGILRYHVSLGESVAAGQRIATNSSVFGEKQNVLRSPVDGIVLSLKTLPMVKPGEPICHIAIPSRSLTSIRKKITQHRRKNNNERGDQLSILNVSRSEREAEYYDRGED